jgi:hypothetical protein
VGVLQRYTSNAARLRTKLGLSNTSEETLARPCEKSGMCLICLGDEELMGEECGHQFCIYCWRDYLHKEVKLKHTVILCPGKDCSKVLDELTVIGYLDDEETKASQAKKEKKGEGEEKKVFLFLHLLKKRTGFGRHWFSRLWTTTSWCGGVRQRIAPTPSYCTRFWRARTRASLAAAE